KSSVPHPCEFVLSLGWAGKQLSLSRAVRLFLSGVNIMPAMRVIRLSLLLAVSAVAAAQSPAPTSLAPLHWQLQDSGATASLRGIDSVDGKVAWASGTGGTVLRTTDGGAHWMKCAVPDGDKDGATLDFRGV